MVMLSTGLNPELAPSLVRFSLARNCQVPLTLLLNVVARVVIVFHAVKAPPGALCWSTYEKPVGAAFDATSTVKVVDGDPVSGVTTTGTRTAPVIESWTSQWYG
jgi:hypothetical protein